MDKSGSRKHENYELLNMIGYGLAKFNEEFVKQFGFKSKTDFYKYLVKLGVGDTASTIKNRQDLLDPFFDNGRRGWWQRKDQWVSRKLFIDSLFGNEDVVSFVKIVKMYLQKDFKADIGEEMQVSPLLKSRFKALQETGQEAEFYFLHNYQSVPVFQNGIIEDARNFGDGYDFQVVKDSNYLLAEVKGVKTDIGSIRMTKNEFEKAREYENDYFLVVVSNLIEVPKITPIENPVKQLKLTENKIVSTQINYHSAAIKW
ncbi:MAG: DUF3883 domain-containing protein [Phycisphaerae bacterium]|jgi:hypothetical protein